MLHLNVPTYLFVVLLCFSCSISYSYCSEWFVPHKYGWFYNNRTCFKNKNLLSNFNILCISYILICNSSKRFFTVFGNYYFSISLFFRSTHAGLPQQFETADVLTHLDFWELHAWTMLKITRNVSTFLSQHNMQLYTSNWILYYCKQSPTKLLYMQVVI